MTFRNKVLILGLDGATWTVLKPWVDNGSLPNLAKLMTIGCWGELQSTLPPLTAAAWGSFQTGKNPGKHGVFHFINLDDRSSQDVTGRAEIVDSRSIKSSTLWDILSHHGYRVGLINVPMSYPPRPLNGFMISGLLTPPDASVFTYPPELSEQLKDYVIDLDRFIDHKPFAKRDNNGTTKRVVKPSLELMREFTEMERARGRVALTLMNSQPWDVLMVVFTATDRMGHYLWPYHRAEDLNGLPDSQALHEAVFSYYQQQDEIIGQLIAAAGPEATALVMSDHGMGPINTKITHWNYWLYKKGLQSLPKGGASTPDRWLLQVGLPRDKIGRIVRSIPGLWSSRAIQRIKSAKSADVNREQSKAYYVRIFDPVGGIRVNLEGEEKESLIAELVEELRDVVDPANGKPIVRWAFRRDECFWGPYAEKAPDIILVMHSDYGSSDRFSNYSAIATDRPSINDPGGHHMEGIFVAAGPEIGQIGGGLLSLNILDVAPTLLYLMGIPVPSDMDGRVLTEIFIPSAMEQRPIQTSQPLGRWPSEAEAQFIIEDFQAGDEEAIRERLRALGYVD